MAYRLDNEQQIDSNSQDLDIVFEGQDGRSSTTIKVVVSSNMRHYNPISSHEVFSHLNTRGAVGRWTIFRLPPYVDLAVLLSKCIRMVSNAYKFSTIVSQCCSMRRFFDE